MDERPPVPGVTALLSAPQRAQVKQTVVQHAAARLEEARLQQVMAMAALAALLADMGPDTGPGAPPRERG
jgi:hypothetical protein